MPDIAEPLAAVSGPAIASGPDARTVLVLDPPSLASPRETILLDVSSSLVCHMVSCVSSGDWQTDATKLEDGWTTVKGKKSRFPIPPLDKNLWSHKGGSKSKPKL